MITDNRQDQDSNPGPLTFLQSDAPPFELYLTLHGICTDLTITSHFVRPLIANFGHQSNSYKSIYFLETDSHEKKNKLSSNLNTMQNLFLNKDRKFEVNENYFYINWPGYIKLERRRDDSSLDSGSRQLEEHLIVQRLRRPWFKSLSGLLLFLFISNYTCKSSILVEN